MSDEFWSGVTRITSYGSETVNVVVRPDDLSLYRETLRVAVFLYQFPDGEAITEVKSDAFSRSELPREFELTISASDELVPGERYFYQLFVAPGDRPFEEVALSNINAKFQTDPFSLVQGTKNIRRNSPRETLDPISVDGFTRDIHEGNYKLTFTGRTGGRDWTVDFFAKKSAYTTGVRRSRGRSRPEYVTYELTEGLAGELASLLNDEAEQSGFTGRREKIEFVIDWVQSLPYVPDDVSKGYDDYTKFIIETVTEGNGDCEDTSIVLASVLQADPFAIDTILIRPEGHMLVGILGSESVEGYYYRFDGGLYYPVETTGEGWGVGDLPEQYQDERVELIQV